MSKTKRFQAWYWPIIFTLAVYFFGLWCARQLLGVEPSGVVKLVTYFVLYFLAVGGISWLNSSAAEQTERHPAYDWPVSGPIRVLGHWGVLLVFYPTAFLSTFNPFQLRQQFLQIFGQEKAAKRLKGNELENAQYQTKVRYRLPFHGEWLVFNGGLTESTSHSWQVLAQRYAYDFVKADQSFCRHKASGARLAHYYCYNEPILAAANGEVVNVVDGIGPAPLVGFAVADFLCRHFAGNHVVIRHADGEYGFYAHLIKGSIPVKVGDQVTAGQEIGRCGHTGHSSEPHLHFHLQDTPSIYTSLGLPIRFHIAGNTHEIKRGNRVNTESGIRNHPNKAARRSNRL